MGPCCGGSYRNALKLITEEVSMLVCIALSDIDEGFRPGSGARSESSLPDVQALQRAIRRRPGPGDVHTLAPEGTEQR